ncbi:unnamed protein product [Adineta ricciae]|uniref:EF-hand domain-containing protein n=1 Tax=Adineta ricciae TaxID=249248 RepID=A0A815FL88_ADIRI|nr:unnamed protein product [Adineta ricciae]
MNDLRQRRKEDRPFEPTEQQARASKTSTFHISARYVLIFSLILISSVVLFTFLNKFQFYFNNENTFDEQYYPSEIIHLFRKYDRNYDGHLSLDEFEALASQFNTKKQSTDYIQPILGSDQLVTINAFFQPLNYSTMSQSVRHAYLGNLDELHSLKLWTQPFIPRLNFAARHFKSFLPKQIEIGKPYWIIEATKQQREEHISANRYYPPDVEDDQVIFHRLLSMFHVRPFILSRFPPQGTAAVVRARYGPFLDIYFRIHAEYQLNTPPYHPFWYTPGQLQGRLVIREDASELTYFHMYLPTEKRLNIDMEWLTNVGGSAPSMEVDIGYMPQMELRSAAPSIDMNETKTSPEHFVSAVTDEMYEKLLNSFNWTTEEFLDEKSTYDLLERFFYPFKEVPYYEYRRAFKKAEETNKLIHAIILWVLESSAVLHLLREHFVSTWALVVDLKAIISNQTNEAIQDSQRAKQALDNYAFPVESIIQQPDGTVIAKINANDLLNFESTSEQFLNIISDGTDLPTKRYIHFLEQAINRQN